MPKSITEKPSTDDVTLPGGSGSGGGTVPSDLVDRVDDLEFEVDSLDANLDKFATDFDARSSYFKSQFDNLT